MKLPCIVVWPAHLRAEARHLEDLSWERGICNLVALPWQRRATGAILQRGVKHLKQVMLLGTLTASLLAGGTGLKRSPWP